MIISFIILTVPGFLGSQDTLSRKEIRKQEADFFLQKRPWTIEVPLWIPGYAGSFAYGDVDIEGEDGLDPENPIEPPGGVIGGILSRVFSDDWYLKFFFLTRGAYENNRLLLQVDAFTGSVGEPITGLINQFTWKRWFVVIQGDSGGYFVSSKHSAQIT